MRHASGAQILEELLAENDQAVDVWYLLGMCQHAGRDDESALAALEEGEALAARSGVPATDPSAVGFAQLKVRSSGMSQPTSTGLHSQLAVLAVHVLKAFWCVTEALLWYDPIALHHMQNVHKNYAASLTSVQVDAVCLSLG